MPYWTSDRERKVVTRLAEGERWRMVKAEKSAIYAGWDRESRANSSEARQYKHEVVLELQGKALRNLTSHAYAATCATFSQRWDIYASCIDHARNPPSTLDNAQKQAYADIMLTLAVAARRNPAVQQLAMTLGEPEANENAFEYDLKPLNLPVQRAQVLRDAAKQLDGHHMAADIGTALAEMIELDHEAWLVTCHKLKSRLRVELQDSEDERDGIYWLEVSETDIEVAKKRNKYPGY